MAGGSRRRSKLPVRRGTRQRWLFTGTFPNTGPGASHRVGGLGVRRSEVCRGRCRQTAPSLVTPSPLALVPSHPQDDRDKAGKEADENRPRLLEQEPAHKKHRSGRCEEHDEEHQTAPWVRWPRPLLPLLTRSPGCRSPQPIFQPAAETARVPSGDIPEPSAIQEVLVWKSPPTRQLAPPRRPRRPTPVCARRRRAGRCRSSGREPGARDSLGAIGT
jgi:hypothetical protein